MDGASFEDNLLCWRRPLDILWCRDTLFAAKLEWSYVYHICCYRHSKCLNDGMFYSLLSIRLLKVINFLGLCTLILVFTESFEKDAKAKCLCKIFW